MPKKIKINLAYYLFYFIIMFKYGYTTVNDVDANGIDSNVDKKSTQMSGHLFFHFFCFSTA